MQNVNIVSFSKMLPKMLNATLNINKNLKLLNTKILLINILIWSKY